MAEPAFFLLVDKPEGITSFDVIRRLRKATGIRRIGHTGTLDPFATGLLICCFGVYTRLAQYLEAQSKTYEATIKLGIKTDTGDITGQVIENLPVKDFTKKLDSLSRDILVLDKLPIPAYSAVKIDGKRAYSYARNGELPIIPPRQVRINRFDLLHYDNESVTYRVNVSKGTYIRSLSEWIAEYLDTIGTTIVLRRTEIAEITIDKAKDLESINSDTLQSCKADETTLFSSFEKAILTDSEVSNLINGRTVQNTGIDNDTVIIYNLNNKICSVCSRENNLLKPKINLIHE